MAVQVSLVAGTATAANQAANIDQCQNGGVGPPITLAACRNTNGDSNWVNGNVNGQKAHWQEGEFISYRATLTHLVPGAHALDIHWDVVHGGEHAIDYLGSFDATETTSSTPSQFHENNNDPCGDVFSCTPSSPAKTASIGAFTPANCGGSAGTFSGSQVAGSVKLFGTALTGSASFSYLNENVPAGQGQCSSFGRISFSTTGSDQSVVIAWGGHIASQQDWGTGNSASGISGSPYHMALDLLDGASTGSQDRALSTTAIIFIPNITTTLVPSSSVDVGSSVHDTATLTGTGPSAGGSVFYRYYTSVADCQSDATAFDGTAGSLTHGTDAGTGTVTNGVVGDSNTVQFVSGGSFFWAAFYSGDANNLAVASDCTSEPLHVIASPTLTTQTTPSSGAIGDTLTDSATLSGGFNATGTISFYLFAPGVPCSTTNQSGAVYSSTGITVNGDGTYSSTDGTGLGSNIAMQAGTYQWLAVYSGDNNNNPADSGCGSEPVVIAKNAPKLTTNTNIDRGTLGAILKDSAILKGATSDAGGHINFYLFAPGVSCSASGAGAVYKSLNVSVAGDGTYRSTAGTESGDNVGKVPGTYHWLAVYSGDANNNGANSGCGTEAVVIVKPPPAQPPPIQPPVPVTG